MSEDNESCPRFLFMDTVLIAAPTFSGKEYCMERWLNAVGDISYRPIDVLLVDNSDTLDFYNRWKDLVPMVHLDLDETPDRRIALSMEYIRKKFLARKKTSWWLNIEVDVLVPSYVVDVMLYHAQGVDFVAAPYRHRTEDRWIDGCFGCSMFSRKIAEIGFADAPKDSHTDSYWRNLVLGKYRLNDLPHHILPLEHVNA